VREITQVTQVRAGFATPGDEGAPRTRSGRR
jgi:hypothetical protein